MVKKYSYEEKLQWMRNEVKNIKSCHVFRQLRGHTISSSNLLGLSRSPQYPHGKGLKGEKLLFAAGPTFLFCSWWKASHQNLLISQQELRIEDENVLQSWGDLGFYALNQRPGESCHKPLGSKPSPSSPFCETSSSTSTSHWQPLLSVSPAEQQPTWSLGGPVRHHMQDSWLVLAHLPTPWEVWKDLFPSFNLFSMKRNLELFQPCL